MTVQQVQKKLESMEGNSYEYGKTIHTVVSYEIDGAKETFRLKTDKKEFSRSLGSAKEFFKYWYDRPENKVVERARNNVADLPVPTENASVLHQETSLANELTDILKDAIQKTKTNPGFVNQAKAINSNVNTILNIQKLKLEWYKQFKNQKPQEQ